MKRLACLAAVACLCGCALPGTGRADFIGQSVHVFRAAPDMSTNYVDLGTQTIAVGGTLFVDIFGDQVTVSGTRIDISFGLGFDADAFNGFVISEVGPSPDTITGA